MTDYLKQVEEMPDFMRNLLLHSLAPDMYGTTYIHTVGVVITVQDGLTSHQVKSAMTELFDKQIKQTLSTN